MGGAGTNLRSFVDTYSGGCRHGGPAFSLYCPLSGLGPSRGCLPCFPQDRDLGVVLHGVVCRVLSLVVSR